MPANIASRSRSTNSAVLGHVSDQDRAKTKRLRPTVRTGSCRGRIEQVQPPPPPPFIAPSSDFSPRQPRRRTSPTRSVSPDVNASWPSVSPAVDASWLTSNDFEEAKEFYGYGDMDQEARAAPLPTRDLANIELAQVPADKAPRLGNFLARLQHPQDQIEESDTSDFGDDDRDANRKLNENTQPSTSNRRRGPKHATFQRSASSFGRIEADAEWSSTRSPFSSSTRPGIRESDETDYEYGDADMPVRSNKVTPSMPAVNPKSARPKDVSVSKARRRGSAVGRLVIISESSSADIVIADTPTSLPSSRRRMSVGSSHATMEEKPNMRKAHRRVIADTPTPIPPSHRRMSVGSSGKAHQRGSALGRLEDDSELSSSAQAIPAVAPPPRARQAASDTPSSQPPGHRRMSLGPRAASMRSLQKDPNVGGRSRKDDNCPGQGPPAKNTGQGPPVKAARRGSSALAPDRITLDRLQGLAHRKLEKRHSGMSIVSAISNESCMTKDSQASREYGIPWWS
jgi:hypothetical protein